MDWKNHLEKKIRSKNWKNSKNRSEIAACEQKTTSEKANFCSNIVFSLYFKFGAKKFHAAKPLAFSLHFLFRRDQNHYSNLTSKIMKMCEQILNIAGRLPENSRNRFVDRQSKTVKKTDQKNSSFHWRLIGYILTKNLYVIAASISWSQITFI